jgi:hypothetical protein
MTLPPQPAKIGAHPAVKYPTEERVVARIPRDRRSRFASASPQAISNVLFVIFVIFVIFVVKALMT